MDSDLTLEEIMRYENSEDYFDNDSIDIEYENLDEIYEDSREKDFLLSFHIPSTPPKDEEFLPLEIKYKKTDSDRIKRCYICEDIIKGEEIDYYGMKICEKCNEEKIITKELKKKASEKKLTKINYRPKTYGCDSHRKYYYKKDGSKHKLYQDKKGEYYYLMDSGSRRKVKCGGEIY